MLFLLTANCRRILLGFALVLGSAVAISTVVGRQGRGISIQKQPATYHLSAAKLPPPYATPSVRNEPNIVARPSGARLYTPPGFQIEEWANDLERPRLIEVAPNGDVFVAESYVNRVTVLRPDQSGRPRTRSYFATDLRQPFGIAFYPPGPNPRYVYIANPDSVVRFPYRNGDLKARGPARLLVRLPGGGYNQHWTRTLVFRPDGKKMYVSVGSESNVGIEAPPRACVMEYNPDGTGRRLFASGLRNAVGLGFSPITGALWAAVNERDGLGDNVPPDYVTSVKAGGFYGWPYYYIGAHHDPRMPQRPDLRRKTIVPDVLLEAHCAALSVTFYTGAQFPAAYKNDIFVAMHGSWNRRSRDGYKVVRVRMQPDGRAQGGYEDFAWGWRTARGQVWGRPVYTAIARDGSLLISDDGSNKIWHVAYTRSAKR